MAKENAKKNGDGAIADIAGIEVEDLEKFRAWFAASAATDETGAPQLLFHGTAAGGFARFAETSGRKRGDIGIFATSNWRIARSYASTRDGGAAAAFGMAPLSERYVGDFDLKPAYTRQELIELYGFDIRESDNKILSYTRYGRLVGVFDDEAAAVAASSIKVQALPRIRDNRIGVYSLYMKLENPLVIDAGGQNWNAIEEHGTTDKAAIHARNAGYDGLIVRNVIDSGGWQADGPSDIFVAFHPDQVKMISRDSLEKTARMEDALISAKAARAAARRAQRAKQAVKASLDGDLLADQKRLRDLIEEKREPGSIIRRDIVEVIKSLSPGELRDAIADYSARPTPVVPKPHLTDQHPSIDAELASGSAASNTTKHAPGKASDFQTWFEGSVVSRIDSDGNRVPVRLFHGTTFDFDEFRLGRGARGQARDTKGAIFFTSSPEAAAYHTRVNKGVDRGENPKGANVRPVYLRMVDPEIYDAGGGFKDPDRVAQWIKDAKIDKKDGLIIKNVIDAEIGKAADVYIVFDPSQVRNAITSIPSIPEKQKDARITIGEIPHTDRGFAADTAEYLSTLIPEHFTVYRSVWVSPGESPRLSDPGAYWAETWEGAARSGFPHDRGKTEQVILAAEVDRSDIDVWASIARRRQYGEPEIVLRTLPITARIAESPVTENLDEANVQAVEKRMRGPRI